MHVHVQIDEEGRISDWKIGRGFDALRRAPDL